MFFFVPYIVFFTRHFAFVWALDKTALGVHTDTVNAFVFSTKTDSRRMSARPFAKALGWPTQRLATAATRIRQQGYVTRWAPSCVRSLMLT
ncbi:hypothetical protein EVAR_44714_1 [Eumeta japonica]|uniref:Secreted protein n=1 Tax=Eumeta variegata TaxID=151549 RepID=A0A4C1XKP9_EUMVA|nr:hypothetical protein EVAR_44714_1 [Eumeta japonica]